MVLAGASTAAHTIALLFEVEDLDVVETGDQVCVRITWLWRRHERHGLAEGVRCSLRLARMPTSRMLDTGKVEVSPLLVAMAHLFEKYEGDAYWYGVLLISARLAETSLLVFFHKR